MRTPPKRLPAHRQPGRLLTVPQKITLADAEKIRKLPRMHDLTKIHRDYVEALPRTVKPVALDKFKTMLTSIDHNHADHLIEAIGQNNALAVHEVLTFDVSEVVKLGEI